MALSAEVYEAIVRIVDERVGEIKVTRVEFDKLTTQVSELSTSIQELAKGTDEALREVAGAQKRTDEAVRELAGAQKRTEERVNELAEAQRRTEESVGRLAVAVGASSDTVGYGLEDVAKVMLPPWLEKHERVRVDELERRFLKIKGESVEVNIYGEGVKGAREITVIGESKSRIHSGDVKEFAANFAKIRKELRARRLLPVMFGYWIHPSASALGKTLGIRLVASYER